MISLQIRSRGSLGFRRNLLRRGLAFPTDMKSVSADSGKSEISSPSNQVPKYKSIFTRLSRCNPEGQKGLTTINSKDEVIRLVNRTAGTPRVGRNFLNNIMKESITEDRSGEDHRQQIAVPIIKKQTPKRPDKKLLDFKAEFMLLEKHGIDDEGTAFGCGSMTNRRGEMDRLQKAEEKIKDKKIPQDFSIKASEIDW